MVVVPADSVVTRPLAFTVATARSLLLHVTVRPVSTLLPASRSTAVACTVAPTVTELSASRASTVSTGASVIVSETPSDLPSLVAVMVTVPAASAVTTPLPFTVATEVLLLLHVTGRPVSVAPAALRNTAVACTV